jgi:malonyl-CoA/methylmalonyl-CoA synthetase
MSKGDSFYELLRHRFNNNSDKPALIYRGETISYGELEKRAERAGAFLQAKGLEKGDRVILYTQEKLPFLIIHLGIILSGGISLPLNFNYTADEMKYFIQDSEARFAVASGVQKEILGSIKHECASLQAVFDHSTVTDPDGVARHKRVEIALEDASFMLYSSGTTGRPKGVVHTHSNLAAAVLDIQKWWGFTEDDVLLNVLPFFHIHGLSIATHVALVSGSCTVVEDKFQPRGTMEKIRDATVFMAIPPMYYSFLRRPEFREKAREWRKTRLFTCGSAPIRSEVLSELEDILGRNLINRYGMTECHVLTSLPLDGPWVHGSVGKPLDGVSLKLETEDGTIIPFGTKDEKMQRKVGEVKIKSRNLFSHYWKMPEATGQDFDEEGYFSTGDLGFFDENRFLTLVGRTKDLIITSGYNVYPLVVERVINEFFQVRESAVIGIPDELRGERVVAVVVPEDSLDIEELEAYCREKLVAYQRPVEIRIVGELPRNAAGKVLKARLREGQG